MRGDDDFDPVDAIVRDALRADGEATRRVVSEALAGRQASGRFLLVAAALASVVLIVLSGLFRQPPRETVLIRGEGGSIVIERGSGASRTVETLHQRQASGGIVIIREEGEKQ
jgi:hypothetical protein